MPTKFEMIAGKGFEDVLCEVSSTIRPVKDWVLNLVLTTIVHCSYCTFLCCVQCSSKSFHYGLYKAIIYQLTRYQYTLLFLQPKQYPCALKQTI